MKKHRITVRYIFEGSYEVWAEDVEDAERTIRENCGLVMGRSIQACDDNVADWNFPMHPKEEIILVKQLNHRKHESKR